MIFFRRTLLAIPLILGAVMQTGQTAESGAIGQYPPSIPERDNLSVDFPDEDIENIIRNVAELLGLDLRLPPAGLAGKTSIKLRDVTWRQIFKVTLVPAGYDFYERNGVVAILPQTEFDALPAETCTVDLCYQTSDELVRYLSDLYSKLATFSATSAGLTFSTHPKHVVFLSEEIARLDSPKVRLNPFPRPIFFPDTVPELPETANPTVYINGEPGPGEDPHTTRIFLLEKVDAVAVSKYLTKNFAGKNDRVMVDRRINSVIVTAPESRMPRLEAVTTYLDNKRWYDPKTVPRLSPVGGSPAVSERP